MNTPLTRRSFSKLLLAGGTAAWWTGAPSRTLAAATPALPSPTGRPDEAFWQSVRAQFSLRSGLSPMNAANLCPAPRIVTQVVLDHTQSIEADPSFENRAALGTPAETTRALLAAYVRATPEEIVLTRNTSEANNLVSLGLALKPEDEVILFADNHPSNHAAWRDRAKRYGFTVVELPVPNPHPGPEAYLAAVRAALTPRTRVLAFGHLTSSVGDLFPAQELCALARERGVLTLVDGAQTFGLLDIDLGRMQPDFYTGSAHKWPCGPKEVGFLFVRRDAQERLWPGTISAGAGKIGLSRTHEAFGQRDEAALAAFGTALTFLTSIGPANIEARSRSLTQTLLSRLATLPRVRVWTHPDPARSVAVVSFQPGDLPPRALATALYREHGIACTARTGADRGGLRISPHFYNQPAEIDRLVSALEVYLARGLPTGLG